MAIATVIAVAALAALPGCGTMSSLGGDGQAEGGAFSLPEFTKKADPDDRPTRVGWLSARASHCGFVFDPAQLRARYFAFEQSYGADPRRMQEIQKAYDYSLQSMANRAKEDANYCTRDRVDEIRPELNRYLAGDFRTL